MCFYQKYPAFLGYAPGPYTPGVITLAAWLAPD